MTEQQRLATVFRNRMKNFGIKPGLKKYFDAQAEFFTGAYCMKDHLTGAYETRKSTIPPRITFGILRGEDLCKLILDKE